MCKTKSYYQLRCAKLVYVDFSFICRFSCSPATFHTHQHTLKVYGDAMRSSITPIKNRPNNRKLVVFKLVWMLPISINFTMYFFFVSIRVSLMIQWIVYFVVKNWFTYYNDVIMSTMASQITSLTIAFSIVDLSADQRKHQSSALLAFVRGIHPRPVNTPHKGPVTRKFFPLDDVIMQPPTQYWNEDWVELHTPSGLWIICQHVAK